MKLDQLLQGLSDAVPEGAHGLEIRGVAEDSRRVTPGDLFVAIAGLTVDGHDYAEQAVQNGAAAVVAARPLSLDVPCVVVDSPARALGVAAARLAGQPDASLSLVGVTGTNGKTTTTHIIEAMMAAAGHQVGLVGTICYRVAGRERPSPFTTPTPVLLQQTLAEMVDAGCSHAVMEVSSHALQLGRLWGCSFAIAAFSNLSQDHLDLHGDMDSYLDAKLLLFERHLRGGGVAVVNVDAEHAERVVSVIKRRRDVRLLRCSRAGRPAEVALHDLSCDLKGIHGTLSLTGKRAQVHSSLLGTFNADNLLLAAGCCHAAGVPMDAIAAGVERQTGVPGRLQLVSIARDEGSDRRDPAVVVDYAHTPDALMRAIAVLRPLCRGRLIVVFGCGGDRDRDKRPLMGRAVARGADLAVVTSDNPRSEDPQAIIAQILAGLRGEARLAELTRLDRDRGFVIEPDRALAIETAVVSARSDDVVLLAGKGHEDYQIIGDQRIDFDDREQAARAIATRRRRRRPTGQFG